MIKIFNFVLILLFSSSICSAQQHDYNWIFGAFTFPDDPNANGNIMNFSGDTVSIEVYKKDINIDMCNTTYSDATGNLKFWSNGCEIYGADNEIIENGDSLNYGPVYDFQCDEQFFSSYEPTYQSMLSLPDLQDDQKVYIFHKMSPLDLQNDHHRLNYSVIDFSNSNIGQVIEKNIALEGNTSTGLIAATKDNDFNAWWIITAENRGTGHYIYKLESDSVSSPNYFSEGAFLSVNNRSESSSSFSPDGSKYAIFGEADGLRIYDFDNESGTLSNYQFFDAPQDFDGGFVGLAFSGSGRYLYTSHFRKIYQYDMQANDIGASRLTVADWEENFDTIFGIPSPFFQMQRGPDCRIYLSAQNGNKFIHVIHHPERRGVACGVQQNIEIPAYNFSTTPSFPNYRLGIGPVCDSTKVFPPGLLTAVDEAIMSTAQEGLHVHLYPNPSPSGGKLFLDIDQRLGPDTDFVLYDLSGRETHRQSLSGDVGTTQFRLPSLSAGMYIYSIYSAGRLVYSDKLVVK